MTTRQPSIRIRRDPATAAAVMENPDALHVIRLLPSAGLEGAFRVHIPPDSLDQAQLKLGDLCEISSEDGSTGYGIAWRADDRMGTRPKIRPVKLTEFVRSAFGFQEGSRVNIQPARAKIHHADKIIISDITPAELNRSEDIDDGLWKTRISTLYSNCEALAPGVSFDVLNKHKKTRKRYYIEHIESKTVANDVPSLFKFTDTTQLVLPTRGSIPQLSAASQSDGGPSDSGIATPVMQYQLNTERICGLSEACDALNFRLQKLFNVTEHSRATRFKTRHVMLHGYEGTGKTLMLERLTEAPFAKVLHLNRQTLEGGTVNKNTSIIKDIFRDAASAQPSLILMDDAEELVPADDPTYARVIAAEMRKLQGNRVMVVCAAPSLTSIHKTLLNPEQFNLEFELRIPDLEVRCQILNVLMGKTVQLHSTNPFSLASIVASRTHGFTGRDLAKLYDLADDAADRRTAYRQNADDVDRSKAALQSPVLPRYSQIDATRVSPFAEYEIKLEDYEAVFHKVQPTALREIRYEKPQVTWDQIGGSNDIKKLFDRIIMRPKERRDGLAKFRPKPIKGVLLYGPPGCSKTLTAQAVATAYNYNFVPIKGAELISMYVGESERAVRDLFRKARAAHPCVLFFDEIDSIAGDRDGSGGNSTKGLNVLTTLLNEMDGFEALKDVLILAATNRPATLDSAILRPGRFDTHVYVGLPNEFARKEILKIEMREFSDADCFDFDLSDLVQRMEGYSGAEIVSICSKVQEYALDRLESRPSQKPGLILEDCERALDDVPKSITREMLMDYETFNGRGR